MPYRLADQVSCCAIADQMVVLDLKRDRYLQLPARVCAVVRALVHEPFAPPPDLLALQALLDQGLLEEHPDGGLLAITEAASPRSSLLDDGAPAARLRPGVVISAGADLYRLHKLIAAGCPDVAVAALQRLKRCAPLRSARSGDDAAAVSRAFLTARRVLPIPTVCLLDSLALALHLARQGACADLVFGVKLNPFRAHAWVQRDGVVLNDNLDRVLAHRPIRVV